MNEAEHSVEHPPVQGSHVEGGVVEHPDAKDFGSAAALPADPTWFKHAVFYEVLVRAFFDASADGSGDLRGLIDRLDYLQWLGIDCIWLPPFYDSPLRDGGYDIRDFYKVLPEFGTVDDFVALVDAAHRRGIRIITDLVMNHTSESHPWFQESRRDPDGPYGDYYVWSDTSERYTDARIIFVDTEESNWSFDPVRGRVLLAEANQWPGDVVEYFGDPNTGGDECHMAFHFPLMPRIFMAVRRESRFPISEIIAQTPPIPDMAQWGIFLRNHDELTLEMVTDEERDYMYAEYAKDPRMKANVGIRRRLAPLLDNDRNQIELFTALLLSLPGSPVLYYGDEIGMGDVIWLGDRDGVRIPMQWTPDRNAGFSTANPGRLYLPPSQDPVYGYQAVNVEAQRDTSTSLLNFTRTMLAVRRRHPAFAVGAFQELGGSNPSVLAYVRQVAGDDGDTVLCVNNLSRFPQPIELDLQQWTNYTPVELTGHVEFPRIGQVPYLLTLPGHGFYWFQLTTHEVGAPPTCGGERRL